MAAFIPGLMREGRSLVQNFLGSHEAVVDLSLKIRETMPARPRASTSTDIPMDPDCQLLISYAAQQTSQDRRREAALEVLFVSLLKNQPDWFRQYGLDSEVVAAALSYPALAPPALQSVKLAGVPAVILEFRGVLEEMEGALRPMPEASANEPKTPGGEWSRKQLIGFIIDRASNQHQLCIRALVNQDRETGFPDYDPVAWVMATGYQEMPWSVLMDLCVTYHGLLYDLLSRFPTEKLEHSISLIGNRPPISLLKHFQEFVSNLKQSIKSFPL